MKSPRFHAGGSIHYFFFAAFFDDFLAGAFLAPFLAADFFAAFFVAISSSFSHDHLGGPLLMTVNRVMRLRLSVSSSSGR